MQGKVTASVLRPLYTLLLTALFVGAPGCSPAEDRKLWHGHQRVIDAFYAKPLKEQIATFPAYAFEEQYAIYLYGNQMRHPPALYLSQPFASEGGRVVAALSARLEQAVDDATIRDIVMVFSDIARQKTYDVAHDERLLQLLHRSVARVQDPYWKAFVGEKVSAIGEPTESEG